MEQNKHQQQQIWVGCFYQGCWKFPKMLQVVLATDKVAIQEQLIIISKKTKQILFRMSKT